MPRKRKFADPDVIHHLDKIVELRVLKVIQNGEGKRSNVYLIECRRRQLLQSPTAAADQLTTCVLKTVSSRDRIVLASADNRSSHRTTSTRGSSRGKLQHIRSCSGRLPQLTQKEPGPSCRLTTRSRPRGLSALGGCNYQTQWNRSTRVAGGSVRAAMFRSRLEQSNVWACFWSTCPNARPSRRIHSTRSWPRRSDASYASCTRTTWCTGILSIMLRGRALGLVISFFGSGETRERTRYL